MPYRASGGTPISRAIPDTIPHRTPVTPADAAWSALLPWAVLTAAAVLLLSPLLEGVLFPSPRLHFLPADPEPITPEPDESARYVVLLAATAVLVSITIRASRRTARIPPQAITAIVYVAQLSGAALIGWCFISQYRDLWGGSQFNPRTLIAALAFAVLAGAAASSERIQSAVAQIGRVRNRPVRIALALSATILTAMWLLPAINTERSMAWAFLSHDTAFHFDETFAVINGLTPLVEFHAQYASLFPFLIALLMMVLGKTLLVFTITLCALSAIALLAIYGVIRRAVQSYVLGFALYVPFMATSLFTVIFTPLGRFSPATYFPMFPLRYAGPYLIAWLVARHFDHGCRQPTWLLFGAAGLAAINNFEFGVAAFGATLVAVVCTTLQPTRRYMARLLTSVAVGIGAAVALVTVFALLRTGSMPQLLGSIQFARLYAVAGYSVFPIPAVVGLPLMVFLTYVAAIVTGIVRALNRSPNTVLTGMLVWAGVFGLGSATYYVARSVTPLLTMTFSAWSLALVLLCIAALRAWAADRTLRSTLPSLMVLFGVGLLVCSLVQVPAPWTEARRIERPLPGAKLDAAPWAPAPTQDPDVRAFVSSLALGPNQFVVKSGAPVAIFMTTGHRIADAYDVRDVVPYTGPESIHTVEQAEASLDALRRAGGNTALVGSNYVELLRDVLTRRGFAVLTPYGPRSTPPGTLLDLSSVVIVGGYTKWIDMRYLHPAALR